MPYKTLSAVGGVTVLATLAGAFFAAAFAGEPDAMNDPTAAHAYFVGHSFDFPKNFRFRHPGPEWVLQRAEDFQLTPKQTIELQKLSDKMFDEMKRLDRESIKAYSKYGSDASNKEPEAAQLKTDIDAIGRAESDLAYTMIPYHLKAYELLTAEQKTMFEGFVAKGDGKR